jgi:hypothetical protein
VGITPSVNGGRSCRDPLVPMSLRSNPWVDDHAVSDDDYFVSNAVGHLIGDLDSDDLYGRLTTAERTAALLWVMHGRIRIDGIGGWIESHGPRSDDALEALRLVGATRFAVPFERALALIPTRGADDPDTRLSAMDAWSPEQAESWRRAEDEYLDITRHDDLVDNYVRPFVASHPEDFPDSVDGL